MSPTSRPWWRARRWARAQRLTERHGVIGRPVPMEAALEAVSAGLYRRGDGVWCHVSGSAPVAPARQYALVDVVGCGLADVRDERVYLTRSGWLTLAVARPFLDRLD